jgi:lysophospholipase L1-like esterase
LVAFGDSISSGKGDDVGFDNASADGRNLTRGYSPILNDRLSVSLGVPVTVVNEGLSGTTAAHGAQRLQSTLDRHPEAQIYLIEFGTNDGLLGYPSGLGLTPGQAGYSGSFKDYLQRIVGGVLAAGKIPALAKVPIALGGCSTCAFYADPGSEPLNERIREYNQVIDELVIVYELSVIPPDFYGYFDAHRSEYYDPLHPNGLGYDSMSQLWHTTLTQSGVLD